MNTPTITAASVKVMRSHDYCHFEVCLSSEWGKTQEPPTISEIDELRKTAARLADKAVKQYKIAKANAELMIQDKYRLESIKVDAKRAEMTPESERTPREKSAIKALADYNFTRNRYDYQDDWNEPDYDEESDNSSEF